MNVVLQTLTRFGADPTSVRLFEDDAPELLPYATLLTARAQGNQDLAAVDGVYEWQSAPLLYLVSADSLTGDQNRLSRVRRLLAMRGDTHYLGVVSPGRLEIYRVGLDSRRPEQIRISLGVSKSQEFATLAFLGNNRPGISSRTPWITQVVLNLLSGSIDGLMNRCRISGESAISLVGRALFTRFLADRKLLPTLHRDASDPSEYFDTAARAKKTSAWLDETFNGDFLPLGDDVFEKLPMTGYRILGDVLRRAPQGQLLLGWKESWDHLDFAHIPVGVLSQAYENYLRLHAPRAQRREGGYYTPQPIAELMVKGAFSALDRDGKAHEARALDPAAGGGIFLSTVFRNLVAARWKHDGKRPDTRTLREILYNQITGFDTNEAALRFAALGLYLLSIELDPHPEPLQKLRFTNLRGVVLRKFKGTEEDGGRPLGSLGLEVGKEHIGSYDLVIGNPPWASGTKLPAWSTVKAIVGEIAKSRLGTEVAPPIPNEVLDLPFVWRAMQWAKPGSQIVFALHGRILFQQGDGMHDARKALFQALDVTSVVNGAELRQTKVWPEISAPFCILFARNQQPSEASGFRLVTPRLERSLNNSGNMRIDSASAEIVTPRQISEYPPILKIFSRGGQADLEVYGRILSKGFPTLEKYLSQIFEGKAVSGNGYQKLRKSSRVRKKGDGQRGASADHLIGLREVTPESMQSVLISARLLGQFQHRRIHDPRPRELFRGPLLILQKSPPAALGRIRVGVSKRDVVFNETYYGYSAHNHPDGFALVRYLAMVLGSKPSLWFTLVTSGEFGFEREVIEKATIDKTVVPAFEDFTPADRRKMDDLFASLAKDLDGAWEDVDAWVARLYGLKPRDLDVISDTLKYSLPFANSRKAAQRAPNVDVVRLFCMTLNSELKTWASRFGKQLTAKPAPLPNVSPWRTLKLYAHNGSQEYPKPAEQPPFEFFKAADQMAASEIVVEDPEAKCIWIGQLDQARYWTQTRARLMARQMIWAHPDFLAAGSE